MVSSGSQRTGFGSTVWIIIGAVWLILVGCAAPMRAEDISVVARSNGAITLELGFVNPIDTGIRRERRDWSDADVAPVLAGADRWLSILKGVDGHDEKYVVHITVRADRGEDSNGAAGIDLLEEVRPGVYLPRHAELVINGDMFSASWTDFAERDLTILHEFGHVFGIGTAFHVFEEDGFFFSGGYPIPQGWPYRTVRDWLTEAPPGSSGRTGYAYRQPMGVAAYNRAYGTDLDFLPIDPDGGHLFTIGYDAVTDRIDRTPWRLADDTVIAPMEDELMGHGSVLSEITLGILQDLGWNVDLSQAEPFPASGAGN